MLQHKCHIPPLIFIQMLKELQHMQCLWLVEQSDGQHLLSSLHLRGGHVSAMSAYVASFPGRTQPYHGYPHFQVLNTLRHPC